MGVAPGMNYRPETEQRRVGTLIDSAIIAEANDGRWMGAINVTEFEDLCGYENTSLKDPCDPQDGTEEVTQAECVTVEPYVIRTYIKASTFNQPIADFESLVKEKLDFATTRFLAAELEYGEVSKGKGWTDNRRLADATQIEAGAAQGIVEGFAKLEDSAMWDGDGETLAIHTSPKLLEFFVKAGLVERHGNLLLSKLGTRIIADVGYFGGDPITQSRTDGELWAYATRLPILFLGDITTGQQTQNQSTDSSTNTEYFTAFRFAAYYLNSCGSYAAKFDYCNEICAP